MTAIFSTGRDAASSPRERKTVFLVVPQGFSARCLLRTEILPTLQAAGCRIVILTPNPDEPYMRTELAGETVRLVSLRSGIEAARSSRLWWLLYHLRRYTLARAWESRAQAIANVESRATACS